MKREYRYGLKEEWNYIIDRIEDTNILYTKVNKIISLGFSDKLRVKGVNKIRVEGNFLDAGCGPGDLTIIIRKVHPKSYIVGFDTSYRFTKIGLGKLSKEDKGYIDMVNGLFEKPPFRENVFHGLFSAYALRDSIHLTKAIKRLSSIIRKNGFIIDIDIGKPSSNIMESLLILYMRIIVPLLSSFYAKNIRNPWKYLVNTIYRIPKNNILKMLFNHLFSYVYLEKYAFGNMIILWAYTKK